MKEKRGRAARGDRKGYGEGREKESVVRRR